jgi:predicted secreted protein
MSDSTKQLNVGETLRYPLPGLGTAGYGWDVQADPSLTVRKEFEARGGGVGASADEVFYVTPTKKGRFTLAFEQKRPWESEVVKRDTLVLVVD